MGRHDSRNDDRAHSGKIRPAMTPEGRERQLVSLAIDLAEKQLREGTASSQVISHYLKMGSTRERLEQERTARENELLTVKTQGLRDQQESSEIYLNAIKAMKLYRGDGKDNKSNSDYDDEEDY